MTYHESAVGRAWERIESWLRTNAPELFASLRPGASAEEIRFILGEEGLVLSEEEE